MAETQDPSRIFLKYKSQTPSKQAKDGTRAPSSQAVEDAQAPNDETMGETQASSSQIMDEAQAPDDEAMDEDLEPGLYSVCRSGRLTSNLRSHCQVSILSGQPLHDIEETNAIEKRDAIIAIKQRNTKRQRYAPRKRYAIKEMSIKETEAMIERNALKIARQDVKDAGMEIIQVSWAVRTL